MESSRTSLSFGLPEPLQIHVEKNTCHEVRTRRNQFCSRPAGSQPYYNREVLNGVGADGVGVKFPYFPVNCSYLPLSYENDYENEDKTKKNKKSEEKRKEGKLPSDTIYTNPIKNLPILAVRGFPYTRCTEMLSNIENLPIHSKLIFLSVGEAAASK